jgi:AcrR family transcriptional regulator
VPRERPVARARARERTRRRLLEVSLRLFVRRGYAGTTVRDIADAAGLSVGLMFHYFPSKQALLQEHARNIDAAIAAVVQRLASGARPLDAFTAVASDVLASMEDPRTRDVFLLASQILTLDSIPRPVKRLVSTTRSVDASVPVIESGQRRGEIRTGDPRALAVAFWGALQGIAEALVWYPRSPVPRAEDVVGVLRPGGRRERRPALAT